MMRQAAVMILRAAGVQEEVMGLRNQYLDKFLPQRKTQQQEPQQPAESAPDPSALQFVHEPITDLDIPSPDRCCLIVVLRTAPLCMRSLSHQPC